MNSFLKWGVIAFFGLAALGALTEKNAKTAPSRASSASTVAVEIPSSSTEEASTPAPTPDPVVSVSFTGPSSVHGDATVLRGTVDPAGAKVRVRGTAAVVKHGHWQLPVTLTRRGENRFRVTAIRKGYEPYASTTIVTRKLTAAEKAAIREAQAERRANERALESAQSYLAMSGFSKQGLFEQLSSSAGEGFTQSEAQWAVDHVNADWNKEAVESARSYLEMSPMSRSELIDQLSSSAGESFTYEQALYAVNKVY